MRMSDYLTKYNSLASEDVFFDVPQRNDFVLSRIGQGRRVLDVGCQGGLLAKLIMNQNNEVWGVEVNPEAAKLAESRGVNVRVANVEDGLPFDDDTFDFIHAGELLESLYDTSSFFQECQRVLKADGKILFSITNLNSLGNRLQIVMGRYPNRVGAYPEDHFGGNVRVFNLQKAKELCRQAGFVMTEVKGIVHSDEAPGLTRMPLRWVSRMFPSFAELLMISACKEI